MLKFLRKNTTQNSDDELVQKYQRSGDLEVLGVLYERYVELVYGVCLKYFKEKTKAEDAVIAIFETLVEKVRTQEIRQFRPWLHVVAKNHCLMQLRKKDHTVSFDEMLPAAQAELVHSAGVLHPVDVFEEDGQQLVLKKCIETLPAQQKHCVEQFYYEDKSYKEIADSTGEALGLVRSNIQNGRRNLRICMEKSGVTAFGQ
ncbi:MAG: sigma-70 family RNA polymerase sigma factor [Saprospiraceae bacterium]|jgi:RNA polymerase sigma-70 factor (ECF subfamily)|nr:sigma-70 family RNA polymerase sigma factor [Saprospiraceae bacterium]